VPGLVFRVGASNRVHRARLHSAADACGEGLHPIVEVLENQKRRLFGKTSLAIEIWTSSLFSGAPGGQGSKV